MPSSLLPLLLFKDFWIIFIDLPVIFGYQEVLLAPHHFPRQLNPSDNNPVPLLQLVNHSHMNSDRSQIPKLPFLLAHRIWYCHLFSSFHRIPNTFLFPPAAPLTNFSQLSWLLFQFLCSHKHPGLPSCTASFPQTIPVIHHFFPGSHLLVSPS